MLSYKFLSKNGVTVGFAVAVLAILVTVVPILLGLSALEPLPQKEQAFAPEGNIFYPGLYVSAILLIAAIALALGLSLEYCKASKRGKEKFDFICHTYCNIWRPLRYGQQ
jgi:hypothetical protein